MKKLIVLLAVLLLLPSVFAADFELIKHSHFVPMKSQFITQGYEFAQIKGMNFLSEPLKVVQWNLNAEVGPLYAFCEMEPVSIPPGAFDLEITIQCQTRTGFTAMYPPETLVRIDGYTNEIIPEGSHLINSIYVDTKPRVPTPFPITTVTAAATSETSASTAGSLMFIAGIGAITILAAIIIIAALKQQEE